jgi:hypothetical protein
VTGVPGQFEPEGDLSDNELKLVEQLYGDPVIPACGYCGGDRVLERCAPGESSVWWCKRVVDGDSSHPIAPARFVQRRHADRDVMRLIAEVRRRRQVETGHAGAEPVTEVDPRQVPLFDLLHLGGPA